MNVLVLIAGVQDPKWPIAPQAAVSDTAENQILSPFDEAALEMALRLRDGDPATAIAVRIAGSEASTRIARSVLALNIADVACFTVKRPWDQLAVAQTLMPLCDGADLILMGREFGDFDDGLIPATLAGLLNVSFFGRAQTITNGSQPSLMRESAAHVERLWLTGRLLASVTNDRRTRLRKPLMKNVMQARQAPIVRIAGSTPPPMGLAIRQVGPAASVRAGHKCTMLEGPVEQQARALALASALVV